MAAENRTDPDWKRYHKTLLQFVSEKVPPSEAEDVVQEIYAKALRGLGSYNGKYAFSTWLFTIAERCCIDHRRAAGRRKKRDEDIAQYLSAAAAAGEKPGAEKPDRPEELLAEVPPKYRRIFKMRYIKRMKYKDIAKAARLPIGTVKTHLHRAKAALNKKYDA